MRSLPLLSVLCIDGDDDTREMLALYLESRGFAVGLVASAEEALRHIETRDFDLYVLESWLPRLDGYELCRWIHQRAARSSQIIFFSGAAREADRQKGIEAGANAYVVKPNFDEFANTINKFIAEAHALKTTAMVRRPEFSLTCHAT